MIPFGGKEPRVDPDAFVAPTAVLIGDVVVEAGASVWFGAVLRADYDTIVVRNGSNVQDNCVVHTNEDAPALIGPDATVGHLCMLHGCIVEEGALVGMGSVVLDRARIGQGSMLAAGSVVTEGQEIPPGVLAAGTPARVRKPLEGGAARWVETAAREYQSLRLRYMEARGADYDRS